MIDWKEVHKLTVNGSPEPPRRLEKSEEEWRKELTEEQFRVTRKHGTERPYSGEFTHVYAVVLSCLILPRNLNPVRAGRALQNPSKIM